jgi:hypothetical protein
MVYPPWCKPGAQPFLTPLLSFQTPSQLETAYQQLSLFIAQVEWIHWSASGSIYIGSYDLPADSLMYYEFIASNLSTWLAWYEHRVDTQLHDAVNRLLELFQAERGYLTPGSQSPEVKRDPAWQNAVKDNWLAAKNSAAQIREMTQQRVRQVAT